MAKTRPWYLVVQPREDLREGKALDAAEFAVHLDEVRDGRAREDYQNPEQFFQRTFLTRNLRQMAAEVVRRLSGEKTATSAVFNMATPFGGGKTHALTLLYHLAEGSKAASWQGVDQIRSQAEMDQIPKAQTAVLVGNEFDSLTGRGGDDGTPLRKTPWAEIAYQLSGEEGFNTVAQHEEERTAPGGDVIRRFLPQDRPSLILIDELMNYVSRNRQGGLGGQMYHFLHNLSEVARGSDRVVLVVSVPGSELDMTAEDQSDYERLKKLLDRVGKAVIMAAEAETSEIIRRRLFEWDPRELAASGKVLLPRDAQATCAEYANWVGDNRNQVPQWFSADHARQAFEDSYPFHPLLLSVFERKWQELPRFQKTRGMLRLLALWVSKTYVEGFQGLHKDPLIGVGSAPLEDALFRSALFEQLGEDKLEGAVTTDICGRSDSHAVRLDQEAVDTLKKARLHRQVATAIFFESNGGQTRQAEATVPEVRLAVAGPSIDIGNVETALDALYDACYYLTTERNRYRFGLKENLNKRFADRRAGVRPSDITERVKAVVQKAFPKVEGVHPVPFPQKSTDIPDRPILTLIHLDPEHSLQDDDRVMQRIEAWTREHGKSNRSYKSALVWVVPESSGPLREDARKLLAWEDIRDEGLKLDELQDRQLRTALEKARRDLAETVWRTYKNLVLLAPDNSMRRLDLGLVTSSAAETLPQFILSQLRQAGELEKDISPRFLVRHWPPSLTEWSTRRVRDAFFASPKFPKLLDPEAVKRTIIQGLSEGLIAYAGKLPSGGYDPFLYKRGIVHAFDVEVSDETVILKAEDAEKHQQPPRLERLTLVPPSARLEPGNSQAFRLEGRDQFGRPMEVDQASWESSGGTIDEQGVFAAGDSEGSFLVTARASGVTGTASVVIGKVPSEQGRIPVEGVERIKTLSWTGEVQHQKWTNFYLKVLSKLVNSGEVRLRVSVEAEPREGISEQQLEEIKAALRELGLGDELLKGREKNVD